MATAKPPVVARDTRRTGLPRHRIRKALVVVLILVAPGLAWSWPRLQARAVLATSYGARVACTCHYLGGRGLPDCRKDFEPGMGLVMLSDQPATHSITATVPLLASQTATFRDGPGCRLQRWAP